MLRFALLALPLLLSTPPALGEASDAYAPLHVAAESFGASATLVEWAPGPEPADAYRVYGAQDGALTLLWEGGVGAAPVPAGFDAYAVSGLKDGAESVLVFALENVGAGCVYVQTHPPGVKLQCDEGRSPPVEIRRLPLP